MDQFSVPGPVGLLRGVRRTSDGPGTPVVFVHNVNGAAEQWSPVMERIANRTSVAVDLRGHGFSHPGGTYGAADYAADVAAVMDGLGIWRAHLVGASFGGSACVMLAARRPARVQSVTVIGGALRVGNVDSAVVVRELRQLGPPLFFEKFAAMSFAPDTDAALRAEAVRWAVRNDSTTVEHIIDGAFSADISATAGQVDAPALVLTGEHDQTCPPMLGAEFARALATECRVLAGRGHLAHIEDPMLVARLINEHLQHADSVPTR